jgi:hypothetical protein
VPQDKESALPAGAKRLSRSSVRYWLYAQPLWVEMNKDQGRVSIEICYSSTPGECWILRASGLTPGMTTQTRRCPTPFDITFQQ